MTGRGSAREADGWQLEGNSAEAYERYLVPAMMARWAAHLVELAAPQPGEYVLDVACGTGIVARTAAPRLHAGGHVVGLDLNEGMLAVARAASTSIHPPIEWRRGSATALPFPQAAFDVVFCQMALPFVSDPSGAVREMNRVLKPRGRVALNVCRSIEHSPGYQALAEALSRHAGAGAGAMMRSPFSPWSLDELRGLVAAAGFQGVRVRIEVDAIRYPSAAELLRQEASSSPLAGPIGALSEEVRATLIAELESALGSHRDDEGVVLPIETCTVLAGR